MFSYLLYCPQMFCRNTSVPFLHRDPFHTAFVCVTSCQCNAGSARLQYTLKSLNSPALALFRIMSLGRTLNPTFSLNPAIKGPQVRLLIALDPSPEKWQHCSRECIQRKTYAKSICRI